MRRIVDDLDGCRRALYEEAKKKIEAIGAIERARGRQSAEAYPVESPLLNEHERRELASWRNLARFQPAVVDYLKAQVLTAEKRYAEALAVLERLAAAHLVRPGVLIETADLYLQLGRWRDAQHVYEKALAIDPDNPQAHIGMCRLALRRRKYSEAAQSALDALQRISRYPLAHFLLGRALAGMKEYERAAEAFRAAISFNPNFPEAHVRLAALLEKHLGDSVSAQEHRSLARRMRHPARNRAAGRREWKTPPLFPPGPKRPRLPERSRCRRSINPSSS